MESTESAAILDLKNDQSMGKSYGGFSPNVLFSPKK